MAIFGAPMPFEDHAWRAAQAALDMRETAAGLQPPGLEETRLPMRIGITSGDVIVGHIGSERRVDYTAVGATVNLAARLQGLAETGDIMIDEAAYSRIEGDVVAEDGGMIPVRGFDEPIHVYRVLRRREARSSATSP
jgi:adenylate cyclase